MVWASLHICFSLTKADIGGDEVKYFASKTKNVFMQKGTTMTSVNWRASDNQQKLILANEKFWKSTAIYYLYAQKNKEENYLWLFPEISEEFVKQLRAMKPDSSSKWRRPARAMELKWGAGSLVRLLEICLLG